MSSKSILIILNYTVSKFARFFLRHSIKIGCWWSWWLIENVQECSAGTESAADETSTAWSLLQSDAFSYWATRSWRLWCSRLQLLPAQSLAQTSRCKLHYSK